MCCLVLNSVSISFPPQSPPNLGGGLDSTVRYTVVVAGANDFSMNYTDVQCDFNNQCSLITTIPRIFTANNINVSVVASNILGTGPPAYFESKIFSVTYTQVKTSLSLTECNPEDLGTSPTSVMSGVINISNGRVLYTGVAPMSVATLECNEGYRPTFDLNRTCMFGGQWSEGTLSCELITVSPSQGPPGVFYFLE